MGPLGGTVAFACIWMISLFLVLPWGIHNPHEAGVQIVKGTDPGAPASHTMWRKLAYTTVIATVIFGILYFAYTRDLIPFEFLKRISQPPHS